LSQQPQEKDMFLKLQLRLPFQTSISSQECDGAASTGNTKTPCGFQQSQSVLQAHTSHGADVITPLGLWTLVCPFSANICCRD